MDIRTSSRAVTGLHEPDTAAEHLEPQLRAARLRVELRRYLSAIGWSGVLSPGSHTSSGYRNSFDCITDSSLTRRGFCHTLNIDAPRASDTKQRGRLTAARSAARNSITAPRSNPARGLPTAAPLLLPCTFACSRPAMSKQLETDGEFRGRARKILADCSHPWPFAPDWGPGISMYISGDLICLSEQSVHQHTLLSRRGAFFDIPERSRFVSSPSLNTKIWPRFSINTKSQEIFLFRYSLHSVTFVQAAILCISCVTSDKAIRDWPVTRAA